MSGVDRRAVADECFACLESNGNLSGQADLCRSNSVYTALPDPSWIVEVAHHVQTGSASDDGYPERVRGIRRLRVQGTYSPPFRSMMDFSFFS